MIAACIDVGTSLIKTVAFDEEGNEVDVARVETEVLRPKPGFAEQDMDQVWDGVAETLGAIGERNDGIELVALTAQGDGCWLVDENGDPTGPAALWSDGRNPQIVERWEQDGTIEKAFRINGSLTFPGLPNAILNWLREHEPERVERADKALYCGGWTFSRLTGERAVDESDASVPLLDIRAGTYSDELLELYDLGWARHLLPDVRRMDGRVGELGEAAARATGLDAGLPVVMAPYDIASTAIGCGAVEPGQACSILGTTLCTEVMVDHVDTDGAPTGFHIAMGVEDRWLRAFPTLAGTEVLTWGMGILGVEEVTDFVAMAEQAPPGAGGLVGMPYLSPAGERAPFLDSGARGMLLGMTLEHDREDVARAILEGLTLVLRDCLVASKAEPTELRVCGGGAASDFWTQLIADVTGVPTLRTHDTELGAKGAFITALVALGREPDFASAVERLVRVRDRTEPREQETERYSRRFEAFLDLREISSQAWRRLAEAREADG
jgi:erythritol kinase (D-erythritol 1-phosphate-forming)